MLDRLKSLDTANQSDVQSSKTRNREQLTNQHANVLLPGVGDIEERMLISALPQQLVDRLRKLP